MLQSDALRGTFLHVKLQISSLETYTLFHRTKLSLVATDSVISREKIYDKSNREKKKQK